MRWNAIAATPEQLASYLAQLRDPDYAKREAAVKALGRQSSQSLPLLKAALVKAQAAKDKDYEWWLQAAIGECERR